MTTQPTEVILINGFGVLFVIFNAFGLGLRLPIGKLLAQALAHWRIAVWVLVINFAIIPLLFIGYLVTAYPSRSTWLTCNSAYRYRPGISPGRCCSFCSCRWR